MKYAIITLVWAASVAGAFFYGREVGIDTEINRQVEIKQAIEDTRTQAALGAASEISKLKIKNTTIQGKVIEVVRDNPVYRDCKHDDAGMQLINEALTGK